MVVCAQGVKPNFDPVLGHQMKEAFAPVDQHHRFTIEDFIETQGGNLFRPVEAPDSPIHA